MTKLEQALHILSEYISETRRFRLHTAALKRSTHVSLLLENITDFGNQNAALRTMEGLGFHNVHRIFVNELKNRRATRTDAGAKQWLNVQEWGSTRSCVQYLRSAGYVIASAQLEATHTLEDIKLDQKLVVAFGNERDGISHELEELSDYTFSLPMWGLVQSYNVSVAVAMTLFHCRAMLTDHVCLDTGT